MVITKLGHIKVLTSCADVGGQHLSSHVQHPPQATSSRKLGRKLLRRTMPEVLVFKAQDSRLSFPAAQPQGFRRVSEGVSEGFSKGF